MKPEHKWVAVKISARRWQIAEWYFGIGKVHAYELLPEKYKYVQDAEEAIEKLKQQFYPEKKGE